MVDLQACGRANAAGAQNVSLQIATREVVDNANYDCITCGPLDMEYHDARDAGDAVCMMCIANGVCDNVARPAKKADGAAIGTGERALRRMVLPDPEHLEREAGDPPRYIPPVAGQLGFDGSVVGSE